jgi:hypothetical protein
MLCSMLTHFRKYTMSFTDLDQGGEMIIFVSILTTIREW